MVTSRAMVRTPALLERWSARLLFSSAADARGARKRVKRVQPRRNSRRQRPGQAARALQKCMAVPRQ
jgi:hypothetical protein